MLNAALVFINKEPEKSPSVKADDVENTTLRNRITKEVAVDTGWDFEIRKKVSYRSATSAYKKFQLFYEEKSNTENVGLFVCSEGKTVEQCPEIILFYPKDKRIVRKRIKNPLFNNKEGSARRLSRVTLPLSPSLAMQSQLFAMLDVSNADQKWIDRYVLEDYQQNEVYDWQSENLPRENNLSPHQMATLCNMVLRYAKLPNLLINFKENIDSCHFSVNSGIAINKKQLNPLPWLIESDKDTFQKIGTIDDSPRIKISDMELTFSLDWGMNETILLHEIAHYISFIVPTSYRLNRGKINLSLDMYTKIFSSHGALFMASFAFLLIRFHNVKKESLYQSLNENNIDHFELDGLSLENFEKALDKYSEKLELEDDKEEDNQDDTDSALSELLN